MNIDFPKFNTRAKVLGFSEKGVFIRSMRRAMGASKSLSLNAEEKFHAVTALLDQALRRIEMSSAFKAGELGEKHARISTAQSLHEDVAAYLNEVVKNYRA